MQKKRERKKIDEGKALEVFISTTESMASLRSFLFRDANWTIKVILRTFGSDIVPQYEIVLGKVPRLLRLIQIKMYIAEFDTILHSVALLVVMSAELFLRLPITELNFNGVHSPNCIYAPSFWIFT